MFLPKKNLKIRIYFLIFFITSLCIVNVFTVPFNDDYNSNTNKCVPIRIKMCSDIAYNMTMFPNLLQHQKQEEAEIEINNFLPLVQVKCSEDLKFFLCTVYAPFCNVLPKPLPPCRHLCMSARNGCENLMNKFGFNWPTPLDCNNFPVDGLCVGENRTSSSNLGNSKYGQKKIVEPNLLDFIDLECPKAMKSRSMNTYQIYISNKTLDQCSLPCKADKIFPMFFDEKIRGFIRLWTSTWATMSLCASAFTALTFLIDLHRFRYPIRPILYLSVCFVGISSVFIIGMTSEGSHACSSISAKGTPLTTQGLDNFWCTVMAVIYYYCQIAGGFWWLILCYVWYLTSNLQWGTEAIEAISSYFHLIAWGLPFLLTVLLLVFPSVDGDMFTGICSMGNLNTNVLFYFVFIPLLITLVIGLMYLVLGIISLLRIRRYLKCKQSDIDATSSKVQLLMIRISTFAILYTIPTIIFLASIFYQSKYFDRWLTEWYSLRCNHGDRHVFGFSTSRHNCPSDLFVSAPDPLLFYAKYSSQLLIGVICAIWVSSGKTIKSYANAYSRLVYG
ncbi:Frizzled-4 [Strongyloides ratti]|uniref:Frizzled-4 n=1 Tax=Strongyloides ratti TaxID=34506 RepID=A0A090L1H5_STRRB|nr:Frizzled-4 [Strongyloides ratti]CEF63636.1 Frizzled-4 [Strongyloides ratti]